MDICIQRPLLAGDFTKSLCSLATDMSTGELSVPRTVPHTPRYMQQLHCILRKRSYCPAKRTRQSFWDAGHIVRRIKQSCLIRNKPHCRVHIFTSHRMFVLYSHLPLGLPIGLNDSGFRIKILYELCLPRASCHALLILLTSVTEAAQILQCVILSILLLLPSSLNAQLFSSALRSEHFQPSSSCARDSSIPIQTEPEQPHPW
jgi:hypothetical protein